MLFSNVMCCKSSLCLCYGNGNKLYLIQFIPSDPLCIYWAVAYKQWTWQHNSCIPGVRCTERWSRSRLVFANFNWLMHDRSPRKQLRVNREQGSRENYELIILKSGYDIVFPQLNVMWRTQHWQSLITDDSNMPPLWLTLQNKMRHWEIVPWGT